MNGWTQGMITLTLHCYKYLRTFSAKNVNNMKLLPEDGTILHGGTAKEIYQNLKC